MNIFKKFFNLFTSDDNKSSFNDYRKAIFESASKSENRLYGTFSKEGFHCVFNEILNNSQLELIIFIKNFDSIFDEAVFNYFELICSKFEKQSNKIEIYTFDGNVEHRFKELSQKYDCVFYQPLCVKKGGEAQNFIVSDRKSYWLEEVITTQIRNNLNENCFIKGCVNFYDINKSFDLLNYINEIKQNILK